LGNAQVPVLIAARVGVYEGEESRFFQGEIQ
jgi:hypothetical protein